MDLFKVLDEGLGKAFCANTVDEKDLAISQLITDTKKIREVEEKFNAKLTLTDDGVQLEGNAGVGGFLKAPKTFFGIGKGASDLSDGMLNNFFKEKTPSEIKIGLRMDFLISIITGFLDDNIAEEDETLIKNAMIKYMGEKDE